MNTTLPIDPKDFIKKATTVASYYGFVPMDTALKEIGKSPRKEKSTITVPPHEARADTFSNELVNMLQKCVGRNLNSLSKPMLMYHGSITPTGGKGGASAPHLCFGLTAFGIKNGIAEALVLRAARAILEENGFTKQHIHINSMGDKDSAIQFTRELNSYLRKNINDLGVSGRQALKKDVFLALNQLRIKGHPLHADIPKPMEFLSNPSRKHLREVLEYLETVDMPYTIDNQLIGHKDCYRETLFEIRVPQNTEEQEDEEGMVLAKGGRCDEMTRRMFRSDIPLVGILFLTPWKGRYSNHPISKKRMRHPKFFFIQLGSGAKLRSLSVIELLRRAGIPLLQHISEDPLREQLDYALTLKIPYTIIMGQKEALEGSVIVRSMDNQAQETIMLDVMPEYLKKMVQ